MSEKNEYIQYVPENLGKRDPQYGGVLTDISTLPVGTRFYVHNGGWYGQIIPDPDAGAGTAVEVTSGPDTAQAARVMKLRPGGSEDPSENILAVKILQPESNRGSEVSLVTFPGYGAMIPDAVMSRLREPHGPGYNFRTDSDLINFIMSFRDRPLTDEGDVWAHPGELRFVRDYNRDGIEIHEFAGVRTTSYEKAKYITKVAVNVYSPDDVKLVLRTYDGAEFLEPVFEYVPSAVAPGLYETVRK